MVSRVVVADYAVDLADAVNYVIVFLMQPDMFKQPARPLLNRLAVLLVEIEHVILGCVIDDACYLIANLIAGDLRPARYRVIRARMVAGLVSGRNSTTVAPFFILAILF